MQDLTITLVQTDIFWEDKTKNLLQISAILDNVQNTELIILPEMFNTGFSMQAHLLAEKMQGETVEWMQDMARLKKCVVVGSLMIEDHKQYYNRLVWMMPDGEYLFYDKRHLFSMGDEHKHFSAGSKRIYPEINGWKILPLICYDLRFPVWSRQSSPYTEMGNHPYDLLIYIASWPEKRSYAWKQLLIARAIENQCYTIGINRIGLDGNEIYHSGDSCIMDALGEKIFDAENGVTVKSFCLSKQDLVSIRRKYPFLKDRDEYEIKLH